MNGCTMQLMHITIAVLLLMGATGTVLGQGAPLSAPAPGMRAYIDPATGEFGHPPPDAAAAPSGSARAVGLSTAFKEVPGTTPAGGMIVRFPIEMGQSFVATVGADGTRSTRCHTAPGDGEKGE